MKINGNYRSTAVTIVTSTSKTDGGRLEVDTLAIFASLRDKDISVEIYIIVLQNKGGSDTNIVCKYVQYIIPSFAQK